MNTNFLNNFSNLKFEKRELKKLRKHWLVDVWSARGQVEVYLAASVFGRTISGIDPGMRKLGVCVMEQASGAFWDVSVHQIEISGSWRKWDYPPMFRDIFMTLDVFDTVACVEGPSFGSQFGQADLGFIRGVVVSELQQLRNEGGDFIAPAKVKKRVVGDGRYSYDNLWGKKYQDAAAALAMALYEILDYEMVNVE